MKKLVLILVSTLILSGCSLPKNPSLSFGKKCSVSEKGQVSYSYVWIYDKTIGLDADKEQCESMKD